MSEQEPRDQSALKPLDARRRAIRVRAWRRGLREMDILMGGFVDAKIEILSEKEISDLEELLEEQDQTVFSWLCGTDPVPEKWVGTVFDAILAFHRHSGPIHI